MYTHFIKLTSLLCISILCISTSYSQNICGRAETLVNGRTYNLNGTNRINSYLCQGDIFFSEMQAGERVFKLPTVDGRLQISLFSNDIPGDQIKMFAFTCCDDECYDFSQTERGEITSQFISIPVCNIGANYGYLVVDASISGSFEINYNIINEVCFEDRPSCGGELNCSGATAITCGSTNGTLPNNNGSVNTYCNVEFTTLDGPERVYVFRPSESGRYSFDLDFSGGDLDLFILNSCDQNDCLATTADRPGTPDNVDVDLIGGRPYYLVVDRDAGTTRNFNLRISCPRLDCGTIRRDLVCGFTDTWGTHDEARNVSTYCNGRRVSYGGGEVVYRIRPNRTREYTFDMTTTQSGRDLDMFLLSSSCDPDACLAHTDGANTSVDRISYELEAGRTYYLIVDTDLGQGSGESNYRLEVTCKEECMDLSGELPCFPYYPNPNGSWDIDFFLGDEDSRLFDAQNIRITIDDQDITLNGSNALNYTFPVPNRRYTICWYWEVPNGELGTTCYKFCKDIWVPRDPFECPDLWYLPWDNPGSTPYVFRSEQDAIMWILHDDNGNTETRRVGDESFDPNEYFIQTAVPTGMYYITVYFLRSDGSIGVCCKRICYDVEDPVHVLSPDDPLLIQPIFIGQRNDVEQGDYQYQLQSNLPNGASIIKWKWFAKNTSGDDEVITLDDVDFNTSSEQNPVITCPGGPISPEGRTDYCICLLYELNGCYYTFCYDLCLVWPYDVCLEGPLVDCSALGYSYSLTCNANIASIDLTLPVDDVSDSEVLFWSDENGNILQSSPSTSINYAGNNRFVYCHIRRCERYVNLPLPTPPPYCWIEVICIPIPPECGNPNDPCSNPTPLPCNRSVTGDLRAENNNFSLNDYTSCINSNESFNGGDKVYRFVKENSSDRITLNLSHNRNVNLSMFIFDDCSNSKQCIDKGDNTPNDLNILGETWSDNGSLNAGIYYVIIDALDDNQEGPFTLNLECEEACTDLSNQLPCFPYHPNPDGSWDLDFFNGDEDGRLSNAQNIRITIDDQEITLNGSNTLNYNFPTPNRRYTICWFWEVPNGELGTTCYKFCKDIWVPRDPFECPDLWYLPWDNPGSTPYVFRSEQDAIMWILHDDNGNLETRRVGDELFDPNEYFIQTTVPTGMYYITVYFLRSDGSIGVCCKKICYDVEDPVHILSPDDPLIIQPIFIGQRNDVEQGDYQYQLQSNLPAGASIIKWKWFAKNTGDDQVITLDNIDFNTSSEQSPIITCPGGPTSPEGRTDYCICLLYELNGCYYTFCYDLCLVWPYDVCFEGPLVDCPALDYSYSITCNTNIASIDLTLPVDDVSDSEVLFWSDESGNILQSSASTSINYDGNNRLVYCHIRRCQRYVNLPLPTPPPYCWIEVICIPIPPECGNPDDPCSNPTPLPCNRSVTGDLRAENSNFFLNDYKSCINSNESFNGGDKVYRFVKENSSDRITLNLSHNRNVNLSMFIFDDCSNSKQCIDKGDNTPNDLNILGETWSDNGSLNAGIYYVIIDALDDNQEGPFTLNLECEETCTDLSNQLPCFPYYPNPDGSWDIDFFLGDEDSRLSNAQNIRITIDDQDITLNGSNALNYTFPTPNRRYTICWYWEVPNGELGTTCYKFCKDIWVPRDPFECPDLWYLPWDNPGSTPYVFRTEQDAIMWILHDDIGNIETRRVGDESFDPNEYFIQATIPSGMYYITVYFLRSDGSIGVCCKKICYDVEDPVHVLGPDDPLLIQPIFIGQRSDVEQGDYQYQLQSNLPTGASIIKWKWFAKNTGDDQVITLDNIDFNTSSEQSPIITCPGGPTSPEGRTDYCICLLYELNGCYYTFCYDLCLVWPYDVCLSSEQNCVNFFNIETINCLDNEGAEITVSIPTFDPNIPDLPFAEITYWTDAFGNIIQTGDSRTCTIRNNSPYVYCYVLRCPGFVPIEEASCWIEVYCIPIDCEKTCSVATPLQCEDFESYTTSTMVSNYPNWTSTQGNGCLIAEESNGNKFLSIQSNNTGDCEAQYSIPLYNSDFQEITYNVFISPNSGLYQTLNNDIIQLSLRHENGQTQADLIVDNFRTDDGNGGSYIDTDFPLNTWFEIRFITNRITGEFWAYVNGNTLAQLAGTNVGNFRNIYFSSSLTSTSEPTRVDDICLNDCSECSEGSEDYDCDLIGATLLQPGPNNQLIMQFSRSLDINAESWEIENLESEVVIYRLDNGAENLNFGSFQAGASYRICLYYRDADGCLKRCCRKIIIPSNCNSFGVFKNPSASSSAYELVADESIQVTSWWSEGLDVGNASSIQIDFSNTEDQTICCLYYDPISRCDVICCRNICVNNPQQNCSAITLVGRQGDIIQLQSIFDENYWTIEGSAEYMNIGQIVDIDISDLAQAITNDEITVCINYWDGSCFQTCCQSICLDNENYDCNNFNVSNTYDGSNWNFIIVDQNEEPPLDRYVIKPDGSRETIVSQVYSSSEEGSYRFFSTYSSACGSMTTCQKTICVGRPISQCESLVITNSTDNALEINLQAMEGNFEYEWNFGNGDKLTTRSSSITYAYESPDTYTICCSILNACSQVVCNSCNTIEITNDSDTDSSSSLEVRANIQNTCTQIPQGRILLEVRGGVPPYAIDWEHTNSNNVVLDSLPPGNYSVRVTDSRNSTKLSSYTIEELTPASILPVVIDEDCGAENGSISLVSISEVGIRNVVWDAPLNIATPDGILSNLNAGNYEGQVIDVNGCPQNIQLTVGGGLDVSFDLGPDQSICPADSIVLRAPENNTIVSYIWSKNGGQIQGSSESSDSLVVAETGIYQLSISDEEGCSATDQVNVTALPSLIEWRDTTITADPGMELELRIDNAMQVNWSSDRGDLSCENCLSTLVSVDTSINIEVIAIDENECSYSFTISVEVTESRIEGPNMITPNGDGLNDALIFVGLEKYPQNRLTVFNRWGEMIAQINNYQNDWEGTFNGTELSEGVYYYILQYGSNNLIENEIGSDLLIRRNQ